MLTTWHPLSSNVVTNFDNKWRSFGRYNSLAATRPRNYALTSGCQISKTPATFTLQFQGSKLAAKLSSQHFNCSIAVTIPPVSIPAYTHACPNHSTKPLCSHFIPLARPHGVRSENAQICLLLSVSEIRYTNLRLETVFNLLN
jgi:hypothetical protein